MFEVGDVVLYPLYGAGVIAEIKEMEILGATAQYYSLKVSTTGMSVFIPVSAKKETGLRPIISKAEAQKVFKQIPELKAESNVNWNKRYRENLELLKSGNPMDVAQVVKSLMDRDLERGLSTGERRMFVQAKQVLFSELAVALGKDAQTLENELLSAISANA